MHNNIGQIIAEKDHRVSKFHLISLYFLWIIFILSKLWHFFFFALPLFLMSVEHKFALWYVIAELDQHCMENKELFRYTFGTVLKMVKDLPIPG